MKQLEAGQNARIVGSFLRLLRFVYLCVIMPRGANRLSKRHGMPLEIRGLGTR